MKRLWVATLLACHLAAFAETEVRCGQPLYAPFRAHAVLTIEALSSGLEIVGTDQPAIRIACSAADEETAGRVRIRLAGNQDNGKLTVEGAAGTKNLKIRVEVPRKTSLKVRMKAGEVKVEEIAGDKDIEMYAGRIAIDSARSVDYRNVDLSVVVGEVKASAYDVDKGGFFRSYNRESSGGEYGLHAHLMAGEIDVSGARTAAQ